MNYPRSGDLIVTFVFSYLANNGLNMKSTPNYDLAGIVNELCDKNSTSLSIVIISFFIYTGLGNGFSIVISLCVVSRTKELISITFIGSHGLTFRFILYEINSLDFGLVKKRVNLT